MFTTEKGDLFGPSDFDALAQGVNARGIMGSGIATEFASRFPAMVSDYQRLCRTRAELLPGTAYLWSGYDPDAGGIQSVFNLFTQVQPGQGNASMELLEKSLFNMVLTMESIYSYGTGKYIRSVGMPLIGGGVGGLAQHNIVHIMERILGPSHLSFTLVMKEKPETK